MQNPRVNFHCHSKYSDGKHSIAEIFEKLKENEVSYFSLTDHDSIEGTLETHILAKEYGIHTYNGVELTVDLLGKTDDAFFHLLAYDFDFELLNTQLEAFNRSNAPKYDDFIKQLAKDGIVFDVIKRNPKRDYLIFMDILFSLFASGQIKNRAHIFDLLLKKEYHKYRDIRLSKEEAMQMIHNAHGLAILAHPYDMFKDGNKLAVSENETIKLIAELNELGLDGIEAFYRPYSQEQVNKLNAIANDYNFIKSIGTDFHGRESDSMWHLVENEENLLLNHLIQRKSNK